MDIHVVEGPADEPVDVEFVRAHCRVDHDEEDDLLRTYIASARALAAAETNRQFVTATLELQLYAFPSERRLLLPKAPLQEVVSVTYLDQGGDDQELEEDEDFVVHAPAGEFAAPGSIELAYGKVWPYSRCQRAAVRIRYLAGYGDPGDVPAGIRHAIAVGAAEAFRLREESIVGTITSPVALTMARLLAPFRELETCW